MFDSYRDLILSVLILGLIGDNLLPQLSGRFPDIPLYDMAWNAWKYYCSKLLPSNELTYQMNVTENESILSWWEWWTSCGATEVWRTPALWRIYFIRWRFLHNITWLNSHRTGQDLKKIIIYAFAIKKLLISYVTVKLKRKLRQSYSKKKKYTDKIIDR